MVTIPLIIWFLAPLLLGAVVGGLAGFTVAKIAENIIDSLKPEKTEQVNTLNKEAAKSIKNNLKNGNFNVAGGFLVNDNYNNTIIGSYDNQGSITDSAYVKYNNIDSEINNVLRRKEALTW